jgi:hypothetical protein
VRRISLCSRRSTDAAKPDSPRVDPRFPKLCAKIASSCLPSSRRRNCISAKGELVGNGVSGATDNLDEGETDGLCVAVAIDLSGDDSVFEQAFTKKTAATSAITGNQIRKASLFINRVFCRSTHHRIARPAAEAAIKKMLHVASVAVSITRFGEPIS